MPIYTAETAGRPTVVFVARDYTDALAFVNHDFIRSELSELRTPEGAPLWDGRAGVTVRPASADELAAWERDLARDLGGAVYESLDQAVEHNRFVFLVDYLEPDE